MKKLAYIFGIALFISGCATYKLLPLPKFDVRSTPSNQIKIDKYKAAVKQTPNDAELHFNLGEEFFKASKFKEAIEAFNEAFGTLPQNVNYAIKSNYISTLLPMLPQTLIASRGIMVIPTEPENNLANFIEKAKKNIVLIEATE